MPESESLRFKRTIIDDWTLPPDRPSHLEPVEPLPAPVRLPSLGREALSREPFAPADPRRVTMYVCGPTVYNFAHIPAVRALDDFADAWDRALRARRGGAP